MAAVSCDADSARRLTNAPSALAAVATATARVTW